MAILQLIEALFLMTSFSLPHRSTCTAPVFFSHSNRSTTQESQTPFPPWLFLALTNQPGSLSIRTLEIIEQIVGQTSVLIGQAEPNSPPSSLNFPNSSPESTYRANPSPHPV